MDNSRSVFSHRLKGHKYELIPILQQTKEFSGRMLDAALCNNKNNTANFINYQPN